MERKSRWTRDPARGVKGKALVATLTERDLEIFKLFATYRYLPSDYIHALIGGSKQVIVRRLEKLSRRPNCFLNRVQEARQNKNANYRHLVYEIDNNGMAYLAERHIEVRKNITRPQQFVHDFLSCLVMASIELGVKATPDAELVPWEEILLSPKTPEATKKMAAPTFVKTIIDGVETHTKPDWTPFVIKTGTQFLFFGGFEMDRGTEVLKSQNADRERIEGKLAGYLHIMEKQIYHSHFGASSFYMPFIFTSKTRMHSAMKILEELNPKQHGRKFLFKYIPDFYFDGALAPATGHMFTEPWERVGFPPFTIQSPTKEKVAA